MKANQAELDRRAKEIFDHAVELTESAARAAYLEGACGQDERLRQRVMGLMSNHVDDSFLQGPAAEILPKTVVLPVTEKPGDTIDRYKLREKIGEGGCGVVYVAEQEKPIRRRVALKVIKLGMDTQSVIARFEAERQALAMMDHPNIAKVLDAGATKSGRPYFVMELVRGIRITDYCDQARLSTRERLALFTKVCQAVQHAHQKGIIHRDLKPGNILVTLHDGVPVPKVIDFGIAKATEGRLTNATVYTELHQFMGTPAYMSPEQAEMSGLDIDTRSDIYSLGVLLYEMLTGQTPFPADRLWRSGLDEMRRIIREEEPPRPSTRLTTLNVTEATDLSQKRQLKIPALASTLRGDLDWIVMKALEKDRTRRYETANGLAADLQRHLNNEAVLARPASVFYRLQRTYRRNRIACTAAACVFVSLVIALWFIALAARREGLARVQESIQRHAAEQQREQARADRDRAVLAEANATDKATQATNALLTAHERMVKLNVAEGWRRVEEGDHFGALLPFAEAFALEQDQPARAEIHQMRLASVLQHCPKLVNVWSVGTNVTLEHAEFSKDGERLVASWSSQNRSRTQGAAIWETRLGHPLVIEPADPSKENHPDFIATNNDENRIIAVSFLRERHLGNDGRAMKVRRGDVGYFQVLDSTGKRSSPPIQFNGHVSEDSATLSPDGTKLLIEHYATRIIPNQGMPYELSGGFSLLDASTGAAVWRNTSNDYSRMPVLAVSRNFKFSPDGRLVAFGGGILDAGTGRRAVKISDVRSAAFSTDGARLFMIEGRERSLRDAAVLRDGSDPARIVYDWKQGSIPHVGRFSRDGKKLATANSDSSVRIWSAADGSPLTSPMEHEGLVSDVCFSPNGAWLATGTGDYVEKGYSQVWDVISGKPITPRLPNDGPILRVAFSQDGSQLFVAGKKGAIATWSLAGFRVPRFTWSVPGSSWSIKLSPDGKALVCKSGSTTESRWSPGAYQLGSVVTSWAYNLETGDVSLPPLLMRSAITPMSADRMLEGGWAGWSEISLKDGHKDEHSVAHYFKTTNEIHVGASFVRTGGAPPPGRWVAAHHDDGVEILVFDTSNGSVAARLDSAGLSNSITTLLVRQDGKQVLADRRDLPVVCWNLATPNMPELLPGMDGWRPVSYGPSGRLVVFEHPLLGGHRVFETEGFREVLGTNGGVGEFSSDDSWILASDGNSDRWRIFCATNDTIQSPIFMHRGAIICGAFTPGNQTLITAGEDVVLRFWTVPAAEPAALPIALPSEAREILATADGRGFVTVHDDDTVRFWELPKGQRPVSEWLALAGFFAKGRGEQDRERSAAVLSGSMSELAGTSEVSKSASPSVAAAAGDSRAPGPNFRDQWLALRAKHPEVFTVSADEIDAWHRHEAWRCESRQDWSNAVAHLNALLETHPDSGDFLPRRAAAHVAWADELTAAAGEKGGKGEGKRGRQDTASKAGSPPPTFPPAPLLALALADYTRTLAWVDRFPAIAKESRKPFVEKRREVYLKLGRQAEAEADERELKAVTPRGAGTRQ